MRAWSRVLTPLDWLALVAAATLLILGLMTLHSATYTPDQGLSRYVLRQVVWILVGLTVFGLAAWVDYRWWLRQAYWIYTACLGLVILVLFIGHEGFGAQRWLSLGPLSFQPSEVAKVGMIFFCARYFGHRPGPEGYTLSFLLLPGLLVSIPIFLVLKQPDLGTALGFLAIFGAFLYLIRIRSRLLGGFLILGMMLFPFLWQAFWGHLAPYQRMRLLTYVDPSRDPFGAGYHLLQSKIAIGSGGLTGKGWLASTQSHLYFLPARHTDFIFAVFAEERGFLGVVLLLILYGILLVWGLEVAQRAPDRGGLFLAVGFTVMLFFYVAVNIGMTLGLLPVVGLPLPLMSYGGTAMVVTLFSLGVLFNIERNRYRFS